MSSRYKPSVKRVDGRFLLLWACLIALTSTGCFLNDGRSIPKRAIVVTSANELRTTEAGGRVELMVMLSAPPIHTVSVHVASSATSEGTVSPSTLIFTPDDWSAPHSVIVTGVDDDLADGDQEFNVTCGSSTSEDWRFDGLQATPIGLTNLDNDSPGVLVGAAKGSASEAGGQATFTVALASRPASTVTVTMDSENITEGIVSPQTLVFTSDNWRAPQTVTVTGVDDDVADGPRPIPVAFRSIASTDKRYAALAVPSPVTIINTDNDSPGISVSAISGPTTESGGKATFTVHLDSRPAANVTLGLLSNDTTEGTLSVTSLTFTLFNWNANQTVTVSGVDDAGADGDQLYAVTFAASTSSDPNYSAFTPPNVTLSNTDNDSPGISVSAITGPTTESGGQATFTVHLNSRPTGSVVLSPASSDTTEGTLSVTSLTFTPFNWNANQTVTVSGVNDATVDGDQLYAITFGVSSSSDPNYSALTPPGVTLSNTDNDSPGISVFAISRATSESGGQATFTVRLNSQPLSNVVIGLISSDTTEGTLSIASLTFTPFNWSANQTIAVSGVDDASADGNQAYTINFAPCSSSDPNYSALTPSNVALSNTDNDSPGISVSAISGPTSESGGQAAFVVRLNSRPTANVVLGLASSDATEGTVSVSSLTFTPFNWNANQTIAVSGVDDATADGNQDYAVNFAPCSSSDPNYSALTPPNVTLSNTDNDSPGISVSTISGPTSESGGQATFTVRLNSQPTATVVLDLASSDTTEGTLSVTSLSFTPFNWNANQTVVVSGVDDAAADGNQSYAVSFAATTSSDPNYSALTPPNVALSNTDNDSASISVSAVSGPTSESGGQTTFTVRLNSQPTANVVLGLTSSDTTEGTVSIASLTFTPFNWSANQTVIVSGVDDAGADGNQSYAIIFAASTSSDPNYSALTPPNVTLSNTDNDSPGISVSAVSGPTSESGGQATFTVGLNSRPTGNVVLGLASSDTSEGALSVTSLTFTPFNWNANQTVIISGVDDAVADGNQSYTVTLAATTSSDPNYSALTPPNVALSNTDNDSPGISVFAVSGPTTESGGRATFTVHLNSQPTANVVLGLTSSDTTEGTVSIAALTFTPFNWGANQTVTISGVDDAGADGNQSYAVIFAASTSNDPNYSALTAPNVALSNTDDDSPGISVSAMSGPTSESDGQATFVARLNSRPTSNVVLGLASSDTTEGTVSVTSLTFTPFNWNANQTVTVSGVDDVLADGNQSYAVIFAASFSGDPNYSGLIPPNVTLFNTDND